MDRALAAIWRGADLSTLSANSGQGQGASLQGDESALLLEDDAQIVTEALNAQVDIWVLRYLFGPRVVPRAYFKLLPPRRQNVEQDLRVDEFLVRTGAPLSIADACERYGRKLETGLPPSKLLRAPTAANPPARR
jgi:hypothetical protein